MIRCVGTSKRSHTLVERVVCVRLEEEELKSDRNAVQVEYRFPVFTQDVQADVPFEINVGVVDLEGAGGSQSARASKPAAEGEMQGHAPLAHT